MSWHKHDDMPVCDRCAINHAHGLREGLHLCSECAARLGKRLDSIEVLMLRRLHLERQGRETNIRSAGS